MMAWLRARWDRPTSKGGNGELTHCHLQLHHTDVWVWVRVGICVCGCRRLYILWAHIRNATGLCVCKWLFGRKTVHVCIDELSGTDRKAEKITVMKMEGTPLRIMQMERKWKSLEKKKLVLKKDYKSFIIKTLHNITVLWLPQGFNNLHLHIPRLFEIALKTVSNVISCIWNNHRFWYLIADWWRFECQRVVLCFVDAQGISPANCFPGHRDRERNTLIQCCLDRDVTQTQTHYSGWQQLFTYKQWRHF